jgi:HPt (histidine-containing phosphotransfer) domain-containing protein
VLSRWLPARLEAAPLDSPQKVAHLPSVLAGFDLRHGMAQLGGNEALYWRLLQRFSLQLSETFVRLPADLQALLDAPDNQQAWQQAQALNHALKGVAGNLAATGLADLTTQLDSQLKQQQPPRAAQVQVMADLIEQALDSLATLPPLPSVSIADDQADIAQALQCLAALATRVKDSEFIDEAALRTLAQSLPPPLREREWGSIRAALDEFDFPRAQALIAQLQQALILLREAGTGADSV